ncbi:Beta-glucuronosyltransferase GlcAT14B-like protein [Drosera capensis]
MKPFKFIPINMERKWAFPLVISSFICIFLLATSFNMGIFSSSHTINSLLFSCLSTRRAEPVFVDYSISQPPPPPAELPPPRFAYLISGSKGDLEKLWRTLKSVYHPLMQYVIHLDLESSAEERLELASRVEKEPFFSKIGNVYMIKKANMVTYRGPTMVSNTLHACAILLRKNSEWDWFINLSASDYPLVSQDDLIYTFSKLNRSLNFIEHTSRLGWKAGQRAMPLIIDPGLYSRKKSDIFWVQPKRSLPTAFKLFTGSAWMVLSRAFVEYLIWGWDNLPRTTLMYYANFVSSPEGYFHTVICNAPEFAKTAVNHDLHYISWDTPPRQHPHTLSLNDTDKMIASNAAFARKFRRDDLVLDRIDRELLGRRNGSFTLGGWCAGKPRCSKVGNVNKLKPGRGAKRLGSLMDRIVFSEAFIRDQCR